MAAHYQHQLPARTVSDAPSVASTAAYDAASDAGDADDGMITVRAHNKKTGEITVMRVRKGEHTTQTPAHSNPQARP